MGASTIGGSTAGYQLVRSAASGMTETDGSSIAGASVAGAAVASVLFFAIVNSL